jgi:GWxTD domain-containing protein
MNMIVAAFVLLAAVTYPNAASESWVDSPEAYFITDAERAEWATLETPAAREAFKERYWLRRDPTPGTVANEFRETIEGRIRYADATFRIEDTPGSRTARGFLFVVFGSPARASQDYLSTPGPGQRGMIGMNEGNETIFRWTWDRERTPELLKVLDKPKFETSVIVEPARRRDRLENPGQALEFRDLLAEKSIVNPDLIAAETVAPMVEVISSLAPADEAAWKVLARGGEGTAPASALVFTPEGSARALVWKFEETAGTESPQVAVRLTGQDTVTPKIWSGAAQQTRQLIASRPGTIWIAAFDVPAGTWSGELDSNRTPGAPLQFAVPAAGEFGVSSLLIGGGPEVGAPADPLFAIGPALFRPRADAQFTPGESLWYFLQFAGPLPEGTRIEPKLMKKGQGIVTTWQPMAPDLVAAGPNLQVAGYEIPLASFEPGEYTLYVTVRAGEQSWMRRADFQIAKR